MTDIQGFGLAVLAWVGKVLLGIVLLPWSIYLVIKQKRFGQYWYEVARGLDILAGKLYEPVFNKKLKNPNCGRQFGGDVPISYDMAVNKQLGCQTKEADWVEENILNKFDKDHLDKTLRSYERRD